MRETVRTQNSVYEIDHENKRVRRVSGASPPTKKFGRDGAWRSVERVERVAGSYLFIWPDGTGTLTSLAEA